MKNISSKGHHLYIVIAEMLAVILIIPSVAIVTLMDSMTRVTQETASCCTRGL